MDKHNTKTKREQQKIDRANKEKYNNQGCLMKIIEYNNANDMVIEFQDKYKTKIHSRYREFTKGEIKNPYYPTVCGVGITGNKYIIRVNGKIIKEYTAWHNMLLRCFDERYKIQEPTYKDVTCSKEWLLFDNFYEWLHCQENFDKWLNGDRWSIDKDIIFKGNKLYSSETCCLTPQSVNSLFAKGNLVRGDLPIGVCKSWNNNFLAFCQNPFTNKQENLGYYSTPEKAFQVYKSYKEDIIKQVAEIEYKNGNITEQCYKAMLNYEVEITD